MAQLLRAARQSRWYSKVDRGNVPVAEIPSDPLGDFNTIQGGLSLWKAEGGIERIIAALAASRERPANFDYILFDDEILSQVGIKSVATDGDVKDEGVQLFHIDLIDLTVHQLCDLVSAIWHSPTLEIRRLQKNKVIKAVQNSVTSSYIEYERLNDNFKSRIDPLA